LETDLKNASKQISVDAKEFTKRCENYENMCNSTFSIRATSSKILEISDIQKPHALSQKVDAFMKIDQKCIIEKLEKINLVEIVN
jgi:hypothetical protein